MAGYRLRDGLSFCRLDRRSIFLDLPADRYFCLSAPLDEAFSALIDSDDIAPERRAVLLQAGILTTCRDNVRPMPCGLAAPAPTAIPDRGNTASFIAMMSALAARAIWHSRVRRRPLATNIYRLERRKRTITANSPSPTAIARTIHAYRRAGRYVSSRDQCLATSMSLMSVLLTLGARPDLVLGVKLHPFQAHCWVQLDGQIVNDEPDLLRPFTPIRVI